MNLFPTPERTFDENGQFTLTREERQHLEAVWREPMTAAVLEQCFRQFGEKHVAMTFRQIDDTITAREHRASAKAVQDLWNMIVRSATPTPRGGDARDTGIPRTI